MVGLEEASDAVRRAVGKLGGSAHHVKRGLQAASEETRQRVSKAGGKAKNRRR